LNLFTVLVGNTSKGRKGTSCGHARSLVSACDLVWEQGCIQTGLSSGEGLIHAVRDETEDDPGVADKRLLVVESEFANSPGDGARWQHSVPGHSTCLDGGNLQGLTKNSPHRATGSHISIIGHITKDELRRELTRTDAESGFGNRFLWGAVQRSKALPDGGSLPPSGLQELQEKIGRGR
jgi:hypothetical protein